MNYFLSEENGDPKDIKYILYDLLPIYPSLEENQLKENGYPLEDLSFSMLVFQHYYANYSLIIIDEIGECLWAYKTLEKDEQQIEQYRQKLITTEKKAYQLYFISQQETNNEQKGSAVYRRKSSNTAPLGYTFSIEK